MLYSDIIKKMTLKEKASLCSGKDFWQTKNIDRLNIKSMFLADGPHGIRKQAAAADHLGLNASIKATCFPTAVTVASSWNTQLGEEMATALGAEAAAQKVNVLLGPGTNIKRNPLCGRNFEYFSEDPYLAGKMAAAYIRGIQKSGVAACLKHFAVNNQETRRLVIDTIVDERTLREIYLTAFEIAIKEGKVKTVMSSYNKLNGTYANENEHLLVDILRKEWDFDGVVVTDWGGCNDRVAGLKCGNELEMPTTDGETNREIIAAVESGDLLESVLDECVDRLLHLIFETGKALEAAPAEFDVNEHHALALKAAEESVVLLKNAENVLPLKKGEKVCVVGDFAKLPRFQGAGSSNVNPTMVDDAVSLISSSHVEYIGFEQGFERYGKKKKSLIKMACKLAKKADTVLVYVGLDECTETEGLDRINMRLPQNQLDLLVALNTLGKKVVAVLACGAAIEMDWADNVDAVVHGYLGGQAGAAAVLNVLLGKVNPSGKLAESYPYSYNDCSSSMHFPGKEKSVEYREGIFVGYRYYSTAGVRVKYPFGFGLSYTNFEYSEIAVNQSGISFVVKNIGSVSGAEVVQAYVGMPNSKIFRADKELKGFAKVYLTAGESKEITLPFDEYTFRFYNTVTQQWEIEGGEYVLSIGASSEDIRLISTIQKGGEANEFAYEIKDLPSYYTGKTADVKTDEFEKLLGTSVPNPQFVFIKKKRIIVDYNTTVLQLRYSRGWTGRFFSGAIRFVHKMLRAFGKRSTANALAMGMFNNPMRGVSRMSGGIISWGQLDGMILMFNGHFFKGWSKFCKEGRKKKKLRKQEKKETLIAGDKHEKRI